MSIVTAPAEEVKTSRSKPLHWLGPLGGGAGQPFADAGRGVADEPLAGAIVL
jgi:hypothetical protein